MTDFLHQADLALGANLGDCQATLNEVLTSLKSAAGVEIVAVSHFYKTSPVESTGPDYLNAVVRVKTSLEPLELLALCQRLEQTFGRVRPAGVINAPRTIDVDVLTYDDWVSTDPRLIVPHPRMLERLFVLVPLRDIDPNWKSPEGEAIDALIERVKREDPSQEIHRVGN